ncbi:transglutaminase family protein [Desulfothermus naphthae]
MEKIRNNKTRVIALLILLYSYLPLSFLLGKNISIAFFCFLFLGYISLKYPKLTSEFLKKVLLCLIFIFLFLIYTPEFVSLDFFVSFLSLMLGLKSCELYSKRDLYILVFLTSFLPVATCLYEQELWVFIYILIYVFLLFLVLFTLTNKYILNWRPFLKECTLMLMFSIPMIVFLFIFFPRLPHAFLGFSKKHINISGLSEEVAPGAISRLVLSNKVAFRVKFDNIPEKIDNLYFRCGVQEKLKHGIAKIVRVKIDKIPLKGLSNSVNNYKIFLEPGSKFLPFLEMTNTRPEISGLLMYEGYFYLTKKQLTSLVGYRLNHIADYVLHTSTPKELDRCLEVELSENPKTQDLVKSMLKKISNIEGLIKQITMIFSKDFLYTLNPPTWPIHNPIDYFVFESKKGFCGHFAVALTYMLRYAHIPARVVTGYRGGELNPLGDYLIVRQSQAHAWVEAFVSENKGWVRIDPVDFISKENIDKSMDELQRAYISNTKLPLIFRHVISAWDYINYKYRIWIVDYSYKKQISLFNRLGSHLKEKFWYILAFLIGLAVIAVLTCIFFIFSRSKKESIYDYFLIFLKKLNKRGIKVDPTYGPLEIKDMLEDRHDLWVSKALLVIELYIKIRYINEHRKEDIGTYKKLIKDI